MKKLSILTLSQMKTNFAQIPRTQASTYCGGSDIYNNEPAHCMFDAISYASGIRGCYISPSDVMVQYSQEYGTESMGLAFTYGLGSDGATIAAELFFNVTYIGYGNSIGDYLAEAGHTAIVAVPVEGNVYHAVNALSISDGEIYYYDPQTGIYGYVGSDQIGYAIGIDGCLNP